VPHGERLPQHLRREARTTRDDARPRAAGVPAEDMALLIEEHDLQLLRLLGLHEEPESAKKYRKLVHGWSDGSHPPAEASQ
jgi:hypothetical protein